jgi:hypothetical protein
MKKQKTRCLIAFGVQLLVIALVIPCSSGRADAFFRRLFRGSRCCQQPVAVMPAQPSPQTSQSQSFSYEPGAAVTPLASQPAAPSGSHYRGTLRHEGRHPVPNLFRGDSKVLGLQRN